MVVHKIPRKDSRKPYQTDPRGEKGRGEARDWTVQEEYTSVVTILTKLDVF